MAAGLLVAIMVYAYPFVLLDTVRRLLEDNPSDDIRQLAAGTYTADMTIILLDLPLQTLKMHLVPCCSMLPV